MIVSTNERARAARRALFASVAAAALWAGIAWPADAADTALPPPPPEQPGGCWVELLGQYVLWDGDGAEWFPSGSAAVKPKDGFAVGGGGGCQLAGSPWSFAVRGTYAESSRRGDSYELPSSYSGEASHRERHSVIDFEVGRDVGLGVLDIPGSTLKLKGGIRFAHFDAKTEAAYSYYVPPSSVGTEEGSIRRRFWGVGPRLGFDGMIPLDDGTFSFDFGLAGAILVGKQRFRDDFLGFSSRETTAVVPNLDAYAALSVRFPMLNSKFSVGYAVDAYFNALDLGLDSRDEGERILHGPMAKLTIGFAP